MTVKNIFIFIFISFSLSFPFIPQAAARTSGTIKIQRSIASSRIPSHIKKRALAHRNLIRRYKRLSAKQKFRLITSMVRTMAALELANAKRQGRRGMTSYNDSLFNPFLSLFITQAYAQSSSNQVCFLGGHLVKQHLLDGKCNWTAARNLHKCSDGSSRIQCNPALFPSKPCVPNLSSTERNSLRIRAYSTTQACAYADAYKVKQYYREDSTGDLESIVVEKP